jgi:hypothetical protein
MIGILESFRRTRPVIQLGPRDMRMDEHMLHEALSSLGEEHPALIAVRQILGDQLAEARSQVGSIELADSPGKLAHTAGGCEWLEYAIFALERARTVKPAAKREA